MRKNDWSTVSLVLVVTLALCTVTSEARPPQTFPEQSDERRVGLISSAVGCLAVQTGTLNSASATVYLEWEGQIEEAFLVLSAAGSRGGHSIYVNGWHVGSAPIWPGGQPCQAGPAVELSIPAEALVQGENRITLTNDADVSDGWTAADLYLEIHGRFALPPAAPPAETPPLPLPPEVGATAIMSDSVWLTSSYDGVSHQVWYQIPDGYTGSSPVPLLLAMHGWGGTGEGMIQFMGAAVNERGWLFVSPNTHGRYYIDGKRSLAWPGAQYDMVDAVEYMVLNYNVDTSRIYFTGPSMGGQATTVMAAKYPDLFAAAAEWMGFTDLSDWYNELKDLSRDSMLRSIRREIDPACDPYGDPDYESGCGTPAAEPFEYQRRSAIEMPQNSRLIPLHIWHNEADELVPVHHAHDLASAINSWHPPVPVTVTTVNTTECSAQYNHCYPLEFDELFDYLAGYTLSFQPPLSVTARSDESKPYYWANVSQTGNDHWSQLEAAYDLVSKTVTAILSDTQPLTVACNLGSAPVAGRIVERAGIGLPATTYLVKGGGNEYLHDYASGYLTTTLHATGELTLTISALGVGISAEPAMVLGGQPAASTITAVIKDQLRNPVPEGTVIEFSTTEGAFPNASSTYTAATAAGGLVSTTLTLGADADWAEVTASVGVVTDSTSVDMIHPQIDLLVTPDRGTIYARQAVTYTYHLTNTGDITLTMVTVVDDNGTPEVSGDDLTVCAEITLAAEAATSCGRSVTLSQTVTNTATVTGQDPLGNDVTDNDATTVIVEPYYVYLPIVFRGN